MIIAICYMLSVIRYLLLAICYLISEYFFLNLAITCKNLFLSLVVVRLVIFDGPLDKTNVLFRVMMAEYFGQEQILGWDMKTKCHTTTQYFYS